MKFENTQVYNIEGALRGMRNPLESWNKSDSGYNNSVFVIGEEDLILAKKLVKAGSEHRKFLREIMISVDITAPLYFWKEFDTYKIGVTANSTSTMHKLATTPITLDCFELDDFENIYFVDFEACNTLEHWKNAVIIPLELLRIKYLETKDKRYWKELIRLLPESWLQKRTVTMNFENLLNMIKQRKGHKLTEWSKNFIQWAENVPYANQLLQ